MLLCSRHALMLVCPAKQPLPTMSSCRPLTIWQIGDCRAPATSARPLSQQWLGLCRLQSHTGTCTANEFAVSVWQYVPFGGQPNQMPSHGEQAAPSVKSCPSGPYACCMLAKQVATDLTSKHPQCTSDIPCHDCKAASQANLPTVTEVACVMLQGELTEMRKLLLS